MTLRHRRRGIHGLVAVSSLIGFTVIMSGILYAVLDDYGDSAGNDYQCIVSASVYGTGPDRAYFVMSLLNLGSGSVVSASAMFLDDHGTEYGFEGDSLDIGSGHTWDNMGSFPASVSGDNLMTGTAVMDDGSVIRCSTA